MTYIEILVAFETEINKINDSVNKPATDDSLFWLNQAVAKFVKQRFSGDLTKNLSYEQTEKRRQDLINLLETRIYDSSQFKYSDNHSDYDEYDITYPENFLYALNEDVVISDIDGSHIMSTCVFECTQDTFMYRINNSLTDFHYNFHRARPVRIRTAKGFKLLTDKNYKIHQFMLGYIRNPKEITLVKPYEEYEDFTNSVMFEIIKIAAQMYIENTSDERYQTISNEVLTQE